MLFNDIPVISKFSSERVAAVLTFSRGWAYAFHYYAAGLQHMRSHLVCYMLQKMIPFWYEICCFSQSSNLDLNMFVWVIAGSHHSPGVILVLVQTGCV